MRCLHAKLEKHLKMNSLMLVEFSILMRPSTGFT